MTSFLIVNSEPSLLTQNNEKVTYVNNDHLENFDDVLEQESIVSIESLDHTVKLKNREFQNKNHDCSECINIANYLITGLRAFKLNNNHNQYILFCNSTLLNLIKKSTQLIQLHLNEKDDITNKWVENLLNELRDIGKIIKDESSHSDRYIPLPITPTFNIKDTKEIKNDSIQEEFGRAIRISIYFCRALEYESLDINRSALFYRKCLSVLPTQFDYNQKNLQQAALNQLENLTTGQYKHLFNSENNNSASNRRPSLILSSRTSSTVSTDSSGTSISSISSSCGSMVCSSCGIEKKRMPICSKCKIQPYCSVRCIKTHKPIHDLDCH